MCQPPAVVHLGKAQRVPESARCQTGGTGICRTLGATVLHSGSKPYLLKPVILRPDLIKITLALAVGSFSSV